MYVLLSGYLPFQGENRNAVFNKISKAAFHFNHKEFSMVSEEGKNLIRKMLVVDPEKRITPTQALKDPWFTKSKQEDGKVDGEKSKLDPDIFTKLREYKGVSTLKKVALNILVKMTADSKDVE
jgi:calcium-dependent protein kinase